MSPAPPTAKKKTKSAASAPATQEKKRQTRKRSAQGAVEAEQVDQKGTALPLGTRIRARLGRQGAQSLLVAIRAGLVFASGLASYLVAMFVAVTVVPNVFLMVATGTGIGPASPLEMQLAHWLAPTLFLIGLIFVLVLVVVRWLWRAQLRLAEKVRRSLLGEEAGI